MMEQLQITEQLQMIEQLQSYKGVINDTAVTNFI